MTLLESLQELTQYPIPDNTVEKYCIVRGLTSSDTFDITIAESDAYRLATADLYLWLYTSPDIREQEINFTQADRDNFLKLANLIYSDLDDPKFFGRKLGFAGENYNGF